jgi:transcriptional regulator with XRE-family HTH domain
LPQLPPTAGHIRCLLPLVAAKTTANFGELVSRLRKERGLTQSDLADRVDVDKETIAKVEQGVGRQWRPSTARRIFETLSKIAPVSARDAAAYSEATGVVTATPQPGHGEEDLQRRRLHRLLDDLVLVAGHQRIANILIALSEAMEIDRRLSTGERFTVKHPPVQRQGFVEQTEVEYERVPPAARPVPKARRSGA